MICAPRILSVFLSTKIFTNPSVDEVVKLRVFAEKRDRPVKALKLPYENPSQIFSKMFC